MKRRILVTLIGLGAALAASSLFWAAAATQIGDVIYQKDSLYHRIFVSKLDSLVTLQFGRRNVDLWQTQVDLTNLHYHVNEYTKLAYAGLFYVPEPQKVLVVGLGGGVIPREMHYHFPKAQVDVAEIDPEVKVVAEKYFEFHEDEKLKVHVDDGRVYIRKLRAQKPVPKYDLVVLDAFNADYIPFHLMTREFLREVKDVLADDGVVVANIFYTNQLFYAELKTFQDVFGPCQVYMGEDSGNAMVIGMGPRVAALAPEQVLARAQVLQDKLSPTFDLKWVASRLRPNIAPGSRTQVLTDDRAPVNWLRSQERQD